MPKPREILPHSSRDALSLMGNLCRSVDPLRPSPACAITVRMAQSSCTIPLPPSWPDHVKSAFLCALGMAHLDMAHVRGWCAISPATEVGLRADNESIWYSDSSCGFPAMGKVRIAQLLGRAGLQLAATTVGAHGEAPASGAAITDR